MGNKNKALLKASQNNDRDGVINSLQDGWSWTNARLEAADIDCSDNTGDTPLMWAATRGHRGIVRFLAEKGANACILNKAGETALMFAAGGGYIDIMSDLLAAAGDGSKGLLTHRNNEGKNALRYAVANRQSTAVSFLVEKGAFINEKCNKGMTALMEAVRIGDLMSVQTLLDMKANLDVQDNEGKTALMHAAMADNTLMIEELLKRGARTDLKCSAGEIAPDMAGWSNRRMMKARIAEREKAATQAEVLRAAIQKEGFNPDESERWVPMGEVAIDRIVTSADSPKLLSNLFNFESGQYILTVKNLLTAESESTNGSLKSFPNQDLLVKAHDKLVELGKHPSAFTPNKFAI